MSNSRTRIDQYLFVDIVRQTYEADKVWKEWIKEYCKQSDKERYAYETFSKRTKRENEGIGSMEVLELWCNMSIEEQKKFINESSRLNELFRDVSTFLSMFQHNV